MPPATPRRLHHNPFEWAVLIASAAVIAAVVGLLGWELVRQDGGGEPRLRPGLGRIEARDGRTEVEVNLHNAGAATAEDAVVEVVYSESGDGSAPGELTFPHVPPRATVRGWVTFPGPAIPRERLQVRVRGYRIP